MSDHAHHHPFQAHHFETGEQQFQAGKLGMWLFLSTEVLFFSGMFCAYAAFRASHPEVFQDAAEFLNTNLGAANTIVLLLSSFTVAWAVRCAQLNNQKGLLANLMVTLFCAGAFMGVKAVEYSLKFEEGLFWRGRFSFGLPGSYPDLTRTHAMLEKMGLTLGLVGAVLVVLGLVLGVNAIGRRWAFFAMGIAVLGSCVGCLIGNAYTRSYEETHHAAEHVEHQAHEALEHEAHGDAATTAEEGIEAQAAQEAASVNEGNKPSTADQELVADIEAEENPAFGGEGPKFLGIFFSIYYAMTGVHAIHILAGIGVFVWIVSRAARHHFEPDYYGPVEYTGLYWHLVDLIWIYLFPLLYLIR